MDATYEDPVDEVQHDEEVYGSADDEYNEDDNMILHRHVAVPMVASRNITATQRNNERHQNEHDNLIGKDVILLTILRSELPVAKATVLSTNPATLVGGQPLGTQYCEVVVNRALKKDVLLPRPYDDMETMDDAIMMPIVWPYNKLKVDDRASASSFSAGVVLRGASLDARCLPQAGLLMAYVLLLFQQVDVLMGAWGSFVSPEIDLMNACLFCF
ncbi:hypothetical protein ACP70R_046072 [Stipagrostis hirtigluma subsp. patula]